MWKIIENLKAVRLSFLVAQNTKQLVLLRQLAMDKADRVEDNQEMITLKTYGSTIDYFLTKHPGLDHEIFPFCRAQELLCDTKFLAEIGEELLNGAV